MISALWFTVFFLVVFWVLMRIARPHPDDKLIEDREQEAFLAEYCQKKAGNRQEKLCG